MKQNYIKKEALLLKKFKINQETIIALATPNGLGAISVIRISGSNAIPILLLKKFLNQKEIKNYQIKSHILST
jgi:tRNA U34 5-carboxymethylaminomethyl modifying GTPase MnmE/TrmE